MQGSGEAGALYDLLSGAVGAVGLLGSQNPDQVPNATLNFLFFDENLNFVNILGKGFDFDAVTTAAATTINSFANWETLVLDWVADRKGYIYVYVANETPGDKVWFDDLQVIHTEHPVVQADDYYPFGLTFNSYKSGLENKYKFQGQEHIDDLDLNWDSFKWRNHQPDLGRFFNVDPLAESYYYNSPYAFSENKVTVHVELEGLESVYIFDQAENPDDKRVYTAEAYVESYKRGVQGPFRFSSFPNNDEVHNTLNTGEHSYNNASGHSGGTQKGLNIVNANGERVAPGTDPDGNAIEMTLVNVHSGVDPNDNAGLHNRGSAGCPTSHPSDSEAFFSNFDLSGPNGNTGNASGLIKLFRGDSKAATTEKNILKTKQALQNLDMGAKTKADNTRVTSKKLILTEEEQ